MLPALNSRLLVQQSVAADAVQPTTRSDLSGVIIPPGALGVAAISCKRLGLISSTHYVLWNEGVIQGEVTIEVADNVGSGPWQPVATVTFQGTAPKQDYVSVSGAQAAFRHRITLPVVGGSVTTRVTGTT